MVTQPNAPETNVIDLMEALKKSVEQTEKAMKKAPPKRRAK